MTKRPDFGVGNERGIRHGPPGSSDGAGKPAGAPKVQRDWLGIVFTASLLVGAAPVFYLVVYLFLESLKDSAADGLNVMILVPVGVAIAYIATMIHFVKFWQGEKVQQVPESQDAGGAAPSGDAMAKHASGLRRNWFMMAFLLLFLAFWTLAILIFSGVFVRFVFEGWSAFCVFPFLLLSGAIVGWIMMFQELKCRMHGEKIASENVPQWPNHTR